jgi:hypothetical protein
MGGRIDGHSTRCSSEVTRFDKKGPQLPIGDFVTILLLASYLAKVSS